jgi:hypothetical protein
MSHFPNRPTTRGKIVDRTFRQLERVVRRRCRLLISSALSTSCFLVLETTSQAEARRALSDLSHPNLAPLQKCSFAIRPMTAYELILFISTFRTRRNVRSATS